MKSYFARLADRATQMPITAPAKAPTVPDPFETVAPLEAAAPAPSSPDTVRAVPPEPVAPPPVVQRHEVIAREETKSKVVRVEPVEPSRAPEPAPLVPKQPEEHVVPTPVQAAPLEPREEPPRTIEKTTEIRERELIREPRDGEDVQLLRKADAFMQPWLERRAPPPPREEAPREEEPPAPLEPQVRYEPAPRLQPAPAPLPRVVEPPPEQPSLVIGKLTVEVMPSAPAPSPRTQIVVMRGAAKKRSRFFSSRRFGLGQF